MLSKVESCCSHFGKMTPTHFREKHYDTICKSVILPFFAKPPSRVSVLNSAQHDLTPYVVRIFWFLAIKCEFT